ncbi:MAG: hypothetical protein Q4Q17_02800 [Tissierellia bacterium]|nr:hypothetical protein [Tissierellia bacterium]
MVKFILGKKGAGKTKWLIDGANKDITEGNGNIAFVDVDDEHIFSLDYNVRLINAKEYGVETLSAFYGFLSGMLAMDYDLEKIYVDSIYKVINITSEDLKGLYETLEAICKKNECEIYINIDLTESEIPEEFKEYSIEVK